MNLISNIFSWLETHYSPTLIVGISIGGIVLGIIFIFLVIACIKIEKLSGVSSNSPIKIIIIAAAPIVTSLCAIFSLDINYRFMLIITAVACVAVFIWNMLTYKTVYAIIFTIVHSIVGFLAGMSIIAFVLLAIIFAVIFLFGGFTGGVGNSASSGGVPASVYDVNTRQTFSVQEINGNLFAYGYGRNTRIRPIGDGRYLDDYGHEYVDHYSDI